MLLMSNLKLLQHYLQALNLATSPAQHIILVTALQGAAWLLLDHALVPAARL